ncbi:MAG: cell division protein ZapA [Gemmatimonadota bacterium]
MSDSKKTQVRVTIFGEEYALRSEMGEDYTRSCAEYVDERVNAVHITGHVPEPHKAAILAAMQITDELFQVKGAESDLAGSVVDRITELRKRIETSLDRGVTQAELGS